MPEISRFFGIIIAMFPEGDEPHHLPHFHVRYNEHEASYRLSPIELISGWLPRRQQRMVEAWAELHEEELLKDWELLENGSKALPIQPLRK